jgi:hypothetical protein
LLEINIESNEEATPLTGRRKLLLIIPAIILIPILLAMAPLSLANKSGFMIQKGHMVQNGNAYSIRVAIICQDDTNDMSLTPAPREKLIKVASNSQIIHSILPIFDIPSESVPLRC